MKRKTILLLFTIFTSATVFATRVIIYKKDGQTLTKPNKSYPIANSSCTTYLDCYKSKSCLDLVNSQNKVHGGGTGMYCGNNVCHGMAVNGHYAFRC